MTSAFIATFAMLESYCVDGGHVMVSRPQPRLNGSWRHTRTILLSGLLLTMMAVTVRAQAPLNQPAAAYSSSNLITELLNKLSGTNKPEATAQQATGQRTRFVIELRKPATYRIRTLDNPRRVVVEMDRVGVRLPDVPRGGYGLIKAMRAGAATKDETKVVIDVAGPVVVESSQMSKQANGSARLEVILSPFRGGRQTASFDTTRLSKLGVGIVQPPVPQPASIDAAPRGKNYRPLIVIDPGHGGRDSGARKFGVNEKDVVLAFAHVLRKKLLKAGRYRVEMTRTSDVFISLDARRRFAERKRAALFIAVHADYANSRARGATIYSLRTHVANRLRRAAATEAAKEVMSDRVMRLVSAQQQDLGAVQGILGDLAQREVHVNLKRTNVFTKFAIAQMGGATTMRSKPHREAAFAVLKTAKVPSVLIELAYVSNRRDAARLQSSRWRDEVATSLTTAVDKYFSHSLSQIPH